ncbi:hypothetical protein BS78_01G266700 [Paspalum vaginatum]|nr:hypothetical protein BS78_01G266700 [Paspalum vaginatum]
MNPSNILVWKVRGLNSTSRQDAVRVLVDSFRADIVCLQETKMSSFSQRNLLSIFGSDFGGFVDLPAVGASGGILVGWRQRIGQPSNFRVDTFSVSVQLCPTEQQAWWLTCVYGPQGDDNKIAFLQELRDIRTSCSDPWVIMGDFNLIYKEEDKSNSNLNRAMMGRFRRLIDDLALKEVPLHGRKFTWSNGQDYPALVRLAG